MLPRHSLVPLHPWPPSSKPVNSELLTCHGCGAALPRPAAIAQAWMYSSVLADGDGKYYCPPCRVLEEE